ncbi:MAG: hypothetical protein COA69_11695 [Robiginitomaculum sp.]|nr:MAG: hypothetical protein COA69_11695 [Robiginitomaculum sp.]
MNISETANLLKNQASTSIKEKLLAQQEAGPVKAEETGGADTGGGTFDSLSQGEDFNTFLTLLTAQVKNQDPLAPLDSTQFVQQLATFSGLELQAKGNQALSFIASLLEQQIALLTPDETPSATDA